MAVATMHTNTVWARIIPVVYSISIWNKWHYLNVSSIFTVETLLVMWYKLTTLFSLDWGEWGLSSCPATAAQHVCAGWEQRRKLLHSYFLSCLCSTHLPIGLYTVHCPLFSRVCVRHVRATEKAASLLLYWEADSLSLPQCTYMLNSCCWVILCHPKGGC